MYGSMRGDGLTSSSMWDNGDASVWDFAWGQRSSSPAASAGAVPERGQGLGPTGSRTIGRLARFHMARRDREKAQHCSSLQRSTLAIQDRFEDTKPPMRVVVGMVGLPNIVAGITLLTFQITCVSFCNRDRRLQMLNYEMGVVEVLLGVCLSAVSVFLSGIVSDELNNAVVTEMWKEVGRHWSVVLNLLVDVEIHHRPWTRTLLFGGLALVAILYLLAYLVYARLVYLIGFRFVDMGSMHVHCQGLKCIYHQCAFVNTVQLLVVAASTPYFFYGKSHARQRMDHAARCIQARWRDLNRRCRQLFRDRLASDKAKPKLGASKAEPATLTREERKSGAKRESVRFDADVEAAGASANVASASVGAIEREPAAATLLQQAHETTPLRNSAAPIASGDGNATTRPDGEASEVLSADAAAGDASASEFVSYRRE